MSFLYGYSKTFMRHILTIDEAINITEDLHKQKKQIVLAGGCFDIVHLGHIRFLENAKSHGDILIVYIESNETIRKQKGNGRPIYTQQERAEVVAALRVIDYVILLPPLLTNDQYDDLARKLKPAIIAATTSDPYSRHKKRQAEEIGAKLIFVTQYIDNKSTSVIAQLLQKEL